MDISAKRLISFCLCLTAVATGAAFYYGMDNDDDLAAGPLSGLIFHVSAMNTGLEKLNCVAEGSLSRELAAELYKSSALASEAASALAEGGAMWKTDSYIDSVGRCAMNILKGESEEDTAYELGRLRIAGEELLEGLAELKTGLDRGTAVYSELSEELTALENGLAAQNFPQPRMLVMSENHGNYEKYCALAAEYLGYPSGELECEYGLCFTSPDGSRAELTKNGSLLSIYHPYPASESAVAVYGEEYDPASALANASSALYELGFGDTEPGFWQVGEHITATFFPRRAGILFMSDPIYCRLDRNGRILNLSATECGITKVTGTAGSSNVNITQTAARGGYTVMDTRTVMLPMGGGKRLSCIRLHCLSASGREMYLFVNSATGESVDIMLLHADASGFYGE